MTYRFTSVALNELKQAALDYEEKDKGILGVIPPAGRNTYDPNTWIEPAAAVDARVTYQGPLPFGPTVVTSDKSIVWTGRTAGFVLS